MATLYWVNSDTGETVTVKFDATTSEDPTDVVTITDHPVEEGANIVDHARDEPERISIEGYITNTPHQGNLGDGDDHAETTIDITAYVIPDPGTKTIPLDVPSPPVEISESGLLQAGVSALGNLILGGPKNQATVADFKAKKRLSARAKVLKSESGRNRARDAYEKLLAAKSARELVTVQAHFREYFDMLIERVGKPRTSEDGTAVLFQVDLRRIRVAASETVLSPQPAEARGGSGKSLGSQSAKLDPNADAKDEKKDSVLKGLLG